VTHVKLAVSHASSTLQTASLAEVRVAMTTSSPRLATAASPFAPTESTVTSQTTPATTAYTTLFKVAVC
jgi:hypothetical protein